MLTDRLLSQPRIRSHSLVLPGREHGGHLHLIQVGLNSCVTRGRSGTARAPVLTGRIALGAADVLSRLVALENGIFSSNVDSKKFLKVDLSLKQERHLPGFLGVWTQAPSLGWSSRRGAVGAKAPHRASGERASSFVQHRAGHSISEGSPDCRRNAPSKSAGLPFHSSPFRCSGTTHFGGVPRAVGSETGGSYVEPQHF